VDSRIARQSFYTNFTFAFDRLTTATYYSDIIKWWSRRPRPRFMFPVALLPVPAWWQTQCFPSEYPRGQLPWTDSPRTASRGPYL